MKNNDVVVSNPITEVDTCKPSVLTFSGSDSAGLAGMQMDVKVQHIFNVHTLCVLTAVTAQNNQQVLTVETIKPELFQAQMQAVSVFSPKVIKIGLIVSKEQAELIAAVQHKLNIPLIYDPICHATSGSALGQDSVENISDILIPQCSLITPNIPEAEKLAGFSISSSSDVIKAGKVIVGKGAKAVLIKGGHATTAEQTVEDYFYSEDDQFWLQAPFIDTQHTRGTGCAFASAIASSLALGYCLKDAVVIGKMTITQGLLDAKGLSAVTDSEQDTAKGSVNVLGFPKALKVLPRLLTDSMVPIGLTTSKAAYQTPTAFPNIGDKPLGIYPIVDRASWLEKLLPLGVTTIQLRVKDLVGQALEDEIRRAIEIAKEFHCRLFINDYWQLAIKYGAYGVHLGQEDLLQADNIALNHIAQIRQAGLRLGISTHCHYEVARAHAFCPSYIAYGPVFATNSKDMPWIPQGLTGLSYWHKLLSYPLVAIGGINLEGSKYIHAMGVSGIAMISQITQAEDPLAMTQALLEVVRS